MSPWRQALAGAGWAWVALGIVLFLLLEVGSWIGGVLATAFAAYGFSSGWLGALGAGLLGLGGMFLFGWVWGWLALRPHMAVHSGLGMVAAGLASGLVFWVWTVVTGSLLDQSTIGMLLEMGLAGALFGLAWNLVARGGREWGRSMLFGVSAFLLGSLATYLLILAVRGPHGFALFLLPYPIAILWGAAEGWVGVGPQAPPTATEAPPQADS
ncbi:hypothetical protein IIA16_02820 [bacterium]|nr:hypothetical protein [bacterium]